MSVIVPGEGTIFSMKVAATMTPIGCVTEIDGPGINVVVIPTDCLSSTVMTSRPGQLPDPDKISLKIWFDPSDTVTHSLIISRCNTPGTFDDFQITFNDDHTTPAKATFSGFFTSFKLNGMKNQENLGIDCEIKLNTIVTIVAGTP